MAKMMKNIESLLLSLLICVVVFCVGSGEGKSFYGIGQRATGDQLLLKDVLHVRSEGLDEKPQLKFVYSVPEPVTYIEISSDSNVQAHVFFSYDNDIVQGAVESEQKIPKTQPFEALVLIYGFAQPSKQFNPSLVLNQKNEFVGELRPAGATGTTEATEEPEYEENPHDYDESTNASNGDYLYLDPSEAWEEEEPGSEGEDDQDFAPMDKVIEIGKRQKGDLLLYHTYQSSMDTKEVVNHSVIFYYIDSTFITQVKFVLFDHFQVKNLSTAGYVPPLAEYSYFSPHSLKAVITDFNTTFLFVEVFIYGYTSRLVPKTYEPFIKPTAKEGDLFASGVTAAKGTEAPLSPLQRIKHLLNDCDSKEHADNLVIPVPRRNPELCPTPPPVTCTSSAVSIAQSRAEALVLGGVALVLLNEVLKMI